MKGIREPPVAWPSYLGCTDYSGKNTKLKVQSHPPSNSAATNSAWDRGQAASTFWASVSLSVNSALDLQSPNSHMLGFLWKWEELGPASSVHVFVSTCHRQIHTVHAFLYLVPTQSPFIENLFSANISLLSPVFPSPQSYLQAGKLEFRWESDLIRNVKQRKNMIVRKFVILL